MARQSNTLGVVLIIIGILFLLALLLFFVNYYTSKCDEKHLFDKENNLCYYEALNCTMEQKATQQDGKNYCTYKPKSFLSSGIVKGLSIFLAVLFIIILFIVIVMLNMDDEGKVKKLSPKQAINLYSQFLCELHNIPLIDGKFKKDSFRLHSKFTKHTGTGEDIIRCQIELLDGDAPGVYTFDLSLNNTEKDVLEGAADFEKSSLWSFKRPRDFPIFVPTNVQERLLSKLGDINPEKAQMLEEQLVERQLRTGKPEQTQMMPETTEHPQQSQGGYPYPQRPMFRRRPYSYRRTYGY